MEKEAKKTSAKVSTPVSKKRVTKKQLEKDLAESLEGWRRARADYENLNKRVELDAKEAQTMANKELILNLLPVLDNFESAFTTLPEGEDNNWIKGFEYIKKQLETLLDQYGVVAIQVVGNHFDPEFHESIEEVEDKEAQKGTIVEEKRKGYTLNGFVIRPARVAVAK
ncbi:nucleotide exchange factor GrpE [Patescibacteria group bacterium]|nr:nucleotide exchange factor GrpE [Patescibacteria group bacterium]